MMKNMDQQSRCSQQWLTTSQYNLIYNFLQLIFWAIGIGIHHKDAIVHGKGTRHKVLDVVGMAWAVHMGIVPVGCAKTQQQLTDCNVAGSRDGQEPSQQLHTAPKTYDSAGHTQLSAAVLTLGWRNNGV